MKARNSLTLSYDQASGNRGQCHDEKPHGRGVEVSYSGGAFFLHFIERVRKSKRVREKGSGGRWICRHDLGSVDVHLGAFLLFRLIYHMLACDDASLFHGGFQYDILIVSIGIHVSLHSV